MKYLFFPLLLILPLIQPCSGQGQSEEPATATTVIAFGSCSRQNIPNQRWHEILRHNPALWIWLGDNIYGDTHDMQLMKDKYEQQKAYPGYQDLLNSSTEIIGTWDDHDYGVNDGGKNYSCKEESKKLALEFLEVDGNNPVWDHEGLYQAYPYDFEDYKLKVILLDTRYFRDTVFRDPGTRAYLPNDTGDILGEEQWSWLENELKSSATDLHILGSSIQVIPEDHAFEKWANFPAARKRLFGLLEKYPDKKVILLSGDRHIAEISKIELPGLSYPLYDFTSSGLTHSWREAAVETNRHRVSEFVVGLNFGLILIDRKEDGNFNIRFEIRGEEDVLLDEYRTELY
ncbi:MAG: alkaline phosphatase family protein [Cyclobacteriaceae bacterium]|nr:alkaline phosphatase family protein [Cyclobacteriaceae bacterium]